MLRMRSLRRVTVVTVTALVVFIATLRSDVAFGQGQIVVDVKVNGAESYAFLLDTGWEQAAFVMTDETAGLDFDDAAAGGRGPHAMGRRARDVSFEIGSLRLEGAVLDVSPEEQEKSPPP